MALFKILRNGARNLRTQVLMWQMYYYDGFKELPPNFVSNIKQI